MTDCIAWILKKILNNVFIFRNANKIDINPIKRFILADDSIPINSNKALLIKNITRYFNIIHKALVIISYYFKDFLTILAI